MKTIDQIQRWFGKYSDGIRIVFLIHRSKEGGMNNKFKRHLRKIITTNSEEFFNAIISLQDDMKNSDDPLRIYSSVNSRDINKAIHRFKVDQLEVDYSNQENKNSFYLDIKNKFISCLMKSGSRAESNFIIDLDHCDERSFHTIYKILEKKTNIQTYYKTKNGYHIVTDAFDYTKLNDDRIDVHTDGLLLIDF